MAGFDFDCKCTPRERPVLSAILAKAQDLARPRDLELRYQWRNDRYYVHVDGPLPEVESLSPILELWLEGYAEGLHEHLVSRRRKAILWRFLAEYRAAADCSTSHIQSISARLGFVPNSFHFSTGAATHLVGRMRAFSTALVLYRNGFLPAVVMCEEAHGAAELLLRAVVRDEATGAFASLVQGAHEISALNKNEADALLSLKNRRKKVKHKGSGIRPEELNILLDQVLPALHRLAAYVRKART